MTTMSMEESPMTTMSNLSKFDNIDETDESDNESDNVYTQSKGSFKENNKYKKNTNFDEDPDTVEGFHGSQIIEGRNLKNILLALLISFTGYVVAMTCIKNYIPITEYAPHMKKFKNLIYIAIFYVIVYICLEAF